MNRADVTQILELFGGVGSPRVALRNLGIPVKAIDYIEIDETAVRSYNAMFAEDLAYKPQSVVDWDLRPDVLIHGSPCQDISIAGKQAGADEGSETRSSLMWETLRIIRGLGDWKPKVVIWENVKGLLSKTMRANFERYLTEMQSLGYSNNWATLNARDFGLPQNRDRVFTISTLEEPFNFGLLKRREMRPLGEFLQPEHEVNPVYKVTQPSVLGAIGGTGIRRATVLEKWANTITTRQDRTPAQVVPYKDGFRYLTELECWRLQGYTDKDYRAAEAVHPINGRWRVPLYRQAGNSIPVVFFEAIFEALLNEHTY